MKTAIQELHDKWGNEKEWSWEKIESWFKEAKEKEKEQILNAMNYSIYREMKGINVSNEEYYNQTYNNGI